MNTLIDLGGIIDRLQRAGFNISLSERIDAHKILVMTDSLTELRLGLRMIFSKNRQQQQLFDLLWDIGVIQPETPEPVSNINTEKPMDAGLSLKGVQGSIEFCVTGSAPGGMGGQSQGKGSGVPGLDSFTSLVQFSSTFKGATRQLLQGNIRNAAANMIKNLSKQSYSMDDLMRRKIDAINEIEEMLNTIAPQYANYLIKQLEQEYLNLIKERIDILDQVKIKDPFSAIPIEELPLISLTPSPELSIVLRRLGKKLASKHRRKRKQGNQKINLRKTIRANIQRGGTIIELRREQLRKDRPKLMIMTDISSSTLQATRLFLTIVWHAKEVFSEIRFYEFIGSCIDVTTEFRTAKSVDEAMKRSLSSWTENTFGRENSDYYRAMLSFERLNSGRLTSSTTLIVLGDMRDWLGPWKNNRPLSADIFARVRSKLKRIIVLNPEPKVNWDTGDSICKYCINEGVEIYETTDLKKLIDVVLKI